MLPILYNVSQMVLTVVDQRIESLERQQSEGEELLRQLNQEEIEERSFVNRLERLAAILFLSMIRANAALS